MFFQKKAQTWLIWGVVGALLSMGFLPYAIVKKRYSVEESSRLYIKGTSNVNNFTCYCEDQFGSQVFEAEPKGYVTRFQQTKISLTTERFNCKNRKIDQDLQKALRSDQYPYIQVALSETQCDPRYFQQASTGWWDVTAKVRITIAGVSKDHTVYAKARMVGPKRLQVKGEKALRMTDFGIAPPVAMFGLIKVNDDITFCLDLILQVE